VHSPYGIDGVTDTMDRKRVALLFQKTEGAIAQMLDNSDSKTNFTLAPTVCVQASPQDITPSRQAYTEIEPIKPIKAQQDLVYRGILLC